MHFINVASLPLLPASPAGVHFLSRRARSPDAVIKSSKKMKRLPLKPESFCLGLVSVCRRLAVWENIWFIKMSQLNLAKGFFYGPATIKVWLEVLNIKPYLHSNASASYECAVLSVRPPTARSRVRFNPVQNANYPSTQCIQGGGGEKH